MYTYEEREKERGREGVRELIEKGEKDEEEDKEKH